MDAKNEIESMSVETALTVEDDVNADKPSNYIGRNNHFKITSKSDVKNFLSKLHKKHSLISVKIARSSLSFGTVILDINSARNYMILDELYPRNKISSSVQHQKLVMEAQLDGILLQFSVIVDAVSKKNETEFYKVAVPKSVYYFQRRESFRVPINILNPVLADISTGDNHLLHADLRDLSLGGLSANVTVSTEKLAIGDEIPKCTIMTPDGKKISSRLEIIRVDKINPKHDIKLAAKFTNLSAKDKNELSKVLAKLERENIKRIKRNSR